MANNYSPYSNYSPYNNGNFYAQKMQNLQGIKEQVDKQMQDLQNMQQMQQQFTNQQSQPHIQQTFQLSNPVNNNDFDAKYVDNADDVRNVIVYRNTMFISRDMSKLWFKDANGYTKVYEITEIVEEEPKDKKDIELDELKKQVENLTAIVVQQFNTTKNTVESEPIINNIQETQPIEKIESIKKTEKKPTKK